MNRARAARKDVAFVSWVKRQSCVLRQLAECYGEIEAHHAGKKPGRGLKADDRTCIPLCHKHHMELGALSGFFKGWVGDELRRWQDTLIEETQEAYDDGVMPPAARADSDTETLRQACRDAIWTLTCAAGPEPEHSQVGCPDDPRRSCQACRAMRILFKALDETQPEA